MPHRRGALRAAGVGLLLLAGATMAGGAAAEDYAAQVAARRAAIDEGIRSDPASPFTPVAVRMVRTGETAAFGVCGEEPRFDPGKGCAAVVRLRYSADGFVRILPSGEQEAAPALTPAGRFLLALSRQEDRGRILVHDPASPAQARFTGLHWFPPDPRFRFPVEVEPYPERRPVRMTTTAGLVKTFVRHGRVRFAVDGRPQALSVYLLEGADPEDPGAYFIPFRDATSGRETYAVGRYAGLERDEAGGLVLDLNLAGNPNCAYNPYWNCPIPPGENRLEVAIRAGELPYEAHEDSGAPPPGGGPGDQNRRR